MEAELERVRRALAQVCADSREIERELELQVQESNLRCRALEEEVAALRARESANTSVSTNESKDEYDAEAVAARLRLLEINNDELEQEVRRLRSDIEHLREENAELLERLALEGSAQESLAAERLAAEHLRQELRDAGEEIERQTRLRRAAPAPFGLRRSSRLEQLIQPNAELKSKQWRRAS